MVRARLPLLLGIGIALLGALIAADTLRVGDDRAATRGAGTHAADAGALPPGSAPEAASAERRAAVRRRLVEEGRGTYLDSLLLTSDSAIRRWDRPDGVLEYALVRGGAADERLLAEAREALARWAPAPGGLRFVEVADTARATLVFGWTERFTFRRAGQTDLTWDRWGRLVRARVTLALRTDRGDPLTPEARLAVAVHEVGHALGLPHSADTADVMFEATLATAPTARDRATLRLLYDLPVGRVGEQEGAR